MCIGNVTLPCKTRLLATTGALTPRERAKGSSYRYSGMRGRAQSPIQLISDTYVMKKDLGVDGSIILRWIFRKYDVDRIEQARVAGVCECGNKPSGFIKCADFLKS